jgi:hypothetical protein
VTVACEEFNQISVWLEQNFRSVAATFAALTRGKPAIRNRRSRRHQDQAALPLTILNTFEVSR